MLKIKNLNLSFIALLMVLCLLCMCLFSCSFNKAGNTQTFIFLNISECEGIYNLGYLNQSIEKYNSSDFDKKLKGVSYESFFAAKYSSDEMEFEIFAYVFFDSQSASDYFKNVTGKKSNNDKNFSSSIGISKFRKCVFVNERAYCIISNRRYAGEIENSVLPQLFSQPFS